MFRSLLSQALQLRIKQVLGSSHLCRALLLCACYSFNGDELCSVIMCCVKNYLVVVQSGEY